MSSGDLNSMQEKGMRVDGIESSPKLASRRRVLMHIIVCKGCCCGVTEKRKPSVPVEWLKREWRHRRLSTSITLTISEGCLGPCDLANVICITSPSGVVWLGQIKRHKDYARLVDWAEAVSRKDALLPLPSTFDSHRFDRFRSPLFGFEKK
ncbi:(2Fe-2S) ferredoxin domain-containing protein [Candidatus Poribacteria bacterium]|nr:(2Fe-2S) ferredoxin domain-containing protein [Candidatus Poribacteria bacterium]MYB64691.1 (2Fe-2S) ferredoxin domain-containing protein [Candidatus Poribacteria bacterium]MYF56280.1 (2Fe-2S) ferredoxin domain-containing protein [Candidatus Poribacteria bacterium]